MIGIIFVCLVFPWGMSHGEEMTLEDCSARFEEELGKLKTVHRGKHESLRKHYLAALLRLESEVKNEGDLDGLKATRDEMARLDTGGGVGA